jgi:hypothetical protein
MHRLGFEHTTQVFERAKIFHFLDHAATVTGLGHSDDPKHGARR